ncbi:hypothetical protein [Nonomuraea sp. NPDC050786]|uniref:hypothetical protein n=1 Tax=Nonomuraea sp. NPDC050786 TaxID=3154840 RepID=UPI0033D23674
MRSLLLWAATLFGDIARRARSTWLGVAGALLVCVGLALVSLAAALVAAGVFLLILDGRL